MPAASEPRRLFLVSSLVLPAAALLQACGGGNEDPTITLYAVPGSGRVGETITLSADADDDEGIREVRFFRVSAGSEVLLASFTQRPFLLQTTIPTGSVQSVSFNAIVRDTDDNETRSNTVTVTVVT
jgi:hypothetical protein